MTFTLNLDATLTLICIALQLTTLWFCARLKARSPGEIKYQAKPRFKVPKVFTASKSSHKPVMVNEEIAAELEESNQKDRFYLED